MTLDSSLWALGRAPGVVRFWFAVSMHSLQATSYKRTRSANTELRISPESRDQRPESKDRKRLLQSRRRQEICEVLLDARQHHERAGGR